MFLDGIYVTRTRQFGGVSRIRYVSNTDTYRIRHGYVSWTYPRAGPYWAGKPQIGYVSGLPNTAQLPTHLKEHIAPVALPQLPHAQPLVPLPHARLAPPLVAAARRSSLRPRRRRRATAAGTPGPGAPRAATTSRNRGCTAAGTREPPPAWLLQRTSARLKVQRSSSPVLVLSLPLSPLLAASSSLPLLATLTRSLAARAALARCLCRSSSLVPAPVLPRGLTPSHAMRHREEERG